MIRAVEPWWYVYPPSVGSNRLFPPLQIWVMAACVTCIFAVTLSVFPVITVQVKTVYRGSAGWGERRQKAAL
jgi:hypothetical protein